MGLAVDSLGDPDSRLLSVVTKPLRMLHAHEIIAHELARPNYFEAYFATSANEDIDLFDL